MFHNQLSGAEMGWKEPNLLIASNSRTGWPRVSPRDMPLANSGL